MFELSMVTRQNRRPAATVLAVMLLAALIGGQARAQAAQDAGRFLVELTDRAVDQLTEPGLSNDEQERRFRSLIGEGFSVALHCRGGKGRTGTIAARVLVELGSAPALAIERVRAVRPGSIETRAQEEFVHACKLA